VIERPASVVKELLENSLDASATSISISIRQAGRQRIEVADNGFGIPPAELPVAVSRHATSKLVSADELFRISTLGFRGEALASIGSVSRMTITSRASGEQAGSRLVVEGGKVGALQPVGAPQGTHVVVEQLFQNVPARLKFLKQDITERRAIDGLVTRYALAYPRVHIRFDAEGTTALQTAGDGDRRAILAGIQGVELAHQLLEIEAADEGMSLAGYVSPTSVTRSNRREITFFVNGRWVQDIALTTALLQAYHTLLMVGRYPLATLFLDLPPSELDVNVHPAKAEVRFRQPDRVFSFVQRAVKRSMLAYAPIPSMRPALWSSRTEADVAPPGAASREEAEVAAATRSSAGQVAGTATTMVSRTATLPQIPLLRLVGQVGAMYLVAEGPDGLYLIDQHAAHERVLFEKLMKDRELHEVASQDLLTPVVVEMRPDQVDAVELQLSVLASLGFIVERFGAQAFQIRSMPAPLAGRDPEAVLRVLIDEFEEDESPLRAVTEARVAARICKRLAVRAGQALSVEEQRALLGDLEACASPRTCPHGRPTMIHLSVELLERQFGRRGAR